MIQCELDMVDTPACIFEHGCARSHPLSCLVHLMLSVASAESKRGGEGERESEGECRGRERERGSDAKKAGEEEHTGDVHIQCNCARNEEQIDRD